MVRIKRVYEPRAPSDGYRVLVDRLWPRGVSKQAAHLDAWLKDIAPSEELRKWFGHDRERFEEFRLRYRAELSNEAASSTLDDLAKRAARRTVTLVYAAHDEVSNNAVVLEEELERRGAWRAPAKTRPAHPA